MKKTSLLLMIVALFLAVCCVMAACGNEEPEHEHEWGEWVTLSSPDCTKAGMKSRTCACGQEEQVELPAPGHHATDWIVTKDPTCTEKGSKHKLCSVCNAELEVADVDCIEHTWVWEPRNDVIQAEFFNDSISVC